MDIPTSIIDEILECFDDYQELVTWATFWGLLQDQNVQLRLIQLQCQEIINGEGNDTNSVHDESQGLTDKVQVGDGSHTSDDQSRGTPESFYFIRKKGERTFAKNKATETTFTVKVNENQNGRKLNSIRMELHRMFQEILQNVGRNVASNDLGRIVIHHGALNNPIIVPLRPWEEINVDLILEHIENVLNSQEALSIDTSFEINIGIIHLPKGGTKRHITCLNGTNSSLALKKSVVVINNSDNLCMARAIGVCYAKLFKCSPEDWCQLRKSNPNVNCLELALTHRKFPVTYYKNLINSKRQEQGQLAKELCLQAGVSLDRYSNLKDLAAFENLLDVKILVVSAKEGNKFITAPDVPGSRRPCVYLYLIDDNHFHSIVSITGFFSSSYFCSHCLKHYNGREQHQCETTCFVCKSEHCIVTDDIQSCIECGMTCRSIACFERHKTRPIQQCTEKNNNSISKLSPCEVYWKCKSCFKVFRTDKRSRNEHICEEYFCRSCKKYVMKGHLCYIRATPLKDFSAPRFIWLDFETSQDEIAECQEGYLPVKKDDCPQCNNAQCNDCTKCSHCLQTWCGKTEHRPNYCVTQKTCEKCIDIPLTPTSTCVSCGTRCELCENEDLPCFNKCGFRESIFEGNNTTELLGKWLFSDQHKHFKVIAHNMKGYDGYFLLEYLMSQSIRPQKIIYSGSKIMYMEVGRGLHIKIIDSLNFLPMPLSALPKVFGLSQKKGWFPHFFNTNANQHFVGSYPDPSYYGVNFMGLKERKDFFEWYRTVQDGVFDFREEMLQYCRSDVDILRQSCLKFREVMQIATGHYENVLDSNGELGKKLVGAIDPFDYVTIASVCMGIYRTKFLEETWQVKLTGSDIWTPAKVKDGKTCVLIDGEWVNEEDLTNKGIVTRQFISSPIAQINPNRYGDQFSKASIQWLSWLSQRDNIHIQHALNGGEKSIPGTRYKLDGYCEETNTAFEFQGCNSHGCLCIKDRNTCHPLTNQTMDELYALTQKKRSYIVDHLHMKYVCIWEHEFQHALRTDQELLAFVKTLDITDRLHCREAFFGGRVNSSKLYYKVKENEKIKYVDFTSLYPWVNKYAKYPVGHPEIVTSDFKDLSQYFGVAKVKITPSRGHYTPPLPYRSRGKLKFPLCRTCADTENQNPCNCSDDERALTGTWCIPEIEVAIQKGYRLVKIYEVYHWEETATYDNCTGENGLFTEYINTFLKLKQEASGAPNWIESSEDMMKYIKNYFEREGIQLDDHKIEKNPGLRALAKLILNSFWGKFGQRVNMHQTEFITDKQVDVFFRLLTNQLKKVQNFHIISDDMIQLEWCHENDCLPSDNKTNIYLACFTTCWARLRLYELLDQLGDRVVYYDTDSCIFISRPGEYDPPLGDYLGDLTSELDDGDYITEFVSGGPKNYAYLTHQGKEVCKVKGFTLNFNNAQTINFESMKAVVTSQEKQTLNVQNPSKICRNKLKRKLYNRKEDRIYQMVYTKRVKLPNYDTIPYGY